MKLFKRFEIIDEIRTCQDDHNMIEIVTAEGLCCWLDHTKATVAKKLLEKGRIICCITNQASQGKLYQVYIKYSSKDFAPNKFASNNYDIIINQAYCLQDCPGFILLYDKENV